MKNSTITQALISQCNEAILFAKRRQTTAMQLMAEEVLTTCNGIADHCGLIYVSQIISKGIQAIERGEYITLSCQNEEPTILGVDMAQKRDIPVSATEKDYFGNPAESMGVKCPGCEVEITTGNAGGYRCYCQKCVPEFPYIPNTGKSYVIEGTYPDFCWVESTDVKAVNHV
jgi:rRNA maturation endonuclease Nob1